LRLFHHFSYFFTNQNLLLRWHYKFSIKFKIFIFNLNNTSLFIYRHYPLHYTSYLLLLPLFIHSFSSLLFLQSYIYIYISIYTAVYIFVVLCERACDGSLSLVFLTSLAALSSSMLLAFKMKRELKFWNLNAGNLGFNLILILNAIARI